MNRIVLGEVRAELAQGSDRYDWRVETEIILVTRGKL